MSKSVLYFFCLCCLAFSNCPVKAEVYDERAIVQFDGREWIAAFAHANESEILVEYTLEGETVENWTELVTASMFAVPADNESLSYLRDYYKENILKDCPQVNWESLYTSDKMIICTWDKGPCVAPDKVEYTMVCFAQGVQYLHTVYYAARDKAVFQRNKAKWLGLMKQVQFFSPGDADVTGAQSFLSDTSTMIHVIYRYDNPTIPDDAFYKTQREFWRSGTEYFRMEEKPDSTNAMHLLYVCNEPDMWMVNRFDNSGQNVVDPGPTFNTICPVFGEMRQDGLRQLEFGNERAFFDFYGAREIGIDNIDGIPCRIFELPRLYWILRLYIAMETGLPVAITRQGPDMVVGSVRYDLYETNLPLDINLFTKPDGITFDKAIK
ncbi:MAG: hypothetical protein R3F48_02885 [Candidatus Zixiibacteriota bacterium]